MWANRLRPSRITLHLEDTLFKNAYIMIAGTSANSIIGFIFWIVAARLFPTDAVGLTSAIISSVGILAIFSELGLGITIIRFLSNAGKDSNDLLNTCLTLSGLASIVFSFIFISGLSFWSPALQILQRDQAFLLAFVISVVTTTLQTPVLNTFIAMRDTKYIFISNLVFGLFKIPLAILFAILLNSAFSLFISSVLAQTFALAISIGYFLPKVISGYCLFPMVKMEVVKESWHYSISNYISRGLIQITPKILPLMIINTLSPEMNAYFFIAWSIASFLWLIPTSISNSLFAEGSYDEKSLKENSQKSLKLMILLLLPLILLIWITADKFLLLFGQDYSDNGALLLRIIMLSSIPYGINYFYISIARVSKNSANIIKITIATTVLSLAFCYLMLHKIGLIGIGFGYLAAQSIISSVVLFILLKGYKSSSRNSFA